MVEFVKLQPNETIRVSTKSNTIVVFSVSGQSISITDANNNAIATLTAWDMHTLPIDSGDYLISNLETVERYILLIRFFVY